jgi:hypothetical protein
MNVTRQWLVTITGGVIAIMVERRLQASSATVRRLTGTATS